ncbi:MAG TPA: hypothetical protein GXX21_09205 [Syntrophomonadaceae bacterium]|nr:hypothetical protein [Syntrophomonadaceae bacterium]
MLQISRGAKPQRSFVHYQDIYNQGEVDLLEIETKKTILAVITLKAELVAGGGAPIFIASSREEQEKVAFYLSRIMDAMVHDLDNGVMVIVGH